MFKNRNRTRRGARPRRAMALVLAFVACASLCACASQEPASSHERPEAGQERDVQRVEVRVASLKGPTSVGLVGLMSDSEQGGFDNEYSFTIAGAADEVLPGLANGSIDIALVPANAAATLYSKTGGGVKAVDVNTLGVLYVVTGDESVGSIADLAGRKVVMTGKGTTPEHVMGYLLAQAGIDGSVELDFKSEAGEVAAVLAQDPSAIAVLPEPYVTAVCAQNAGLSARVSLTEEWEALQGEDGGKLVTGVTAVRTEFLERHPQAVAEFVEAHRASVERVNADPAEASELVAKYGIIEKPSIARKAIPGCNLTCIAGDEMKAVLSGYLEVLFEEDAASVGGALPQEDFYATELAR